MNAPRPVDMSRYPVFYLTPKSREVTMDSKIHFFFEKKKDSPEEMTQIFKVFQGFQFLSIKFFLIGYNALTKESES